MISFFSALHPIRPKSRVPATAVDAFKAVMAAATQTGSTVTFYSRGDNSGTDAADKAIFKLAGADRQG